MTVVEIKPPPSGRPPARPSRVTVFTVRAGLIAGPGLAGWYTGAAVGLPPAAAAAAGAAAAAWVAAGAWLPREYRAAMNVLIALAAAFAAGVLAERGHLDTGRVAVVAAGIAAAAVYMAWRASRDAAARREFLAMCLDGWARQYKQRLINDGTVNGVYADTASLIGRVVHLTLEALHEDRRLTNRDDR